MALTTSSIPLFWQIIFLVASGKRKRKRKKENGKEEKGNKETRVNSEKRRKKREGREERKRPSTERFRIHQQAAANRWADASPTFKHSKITSRPPSLAMDFLFFSAKK